MKTFLTKTMNIVLICVILCVYQNYAAERFRQAEEYEKEREAAEKAWKAAEKEKEAEYETAGDKKTEDDADGIPMADGVYEGSGAGFGGEIRVRLEIREGKILSAKVLSAEKETPDYLESAKKILQDIVEEQTAEVDTVAGATLSSNGILEGVRNALEDQDGKENGGKENDG